MLLLKRATRIPDDKREYGLLGILKLAAFPAQTIYKAQLLFSADPPQSCSSSTMSPKKSSQTAVAKKQASPAQEAHGYEFGGP